MVKVALKNYWIEFCGQMKVLPICRMVKESDMLGKEKPMILNMLGLLTLEGGLMIWAVFPQQVYIH